MLLSKNKRDFNFSYLIVVLLLFFLIDEFAFVLYNISLFQYMCSNTLSLFLTDEIPILSFAMDINMPLSFLSSDITNPNSFYHLDFTFENTFETNAVSDYNSMSNVSFTSESITVSDSPSVLNKFYKVKMEATNVKKTLLSFYPLQSYIYTIPGESTLIFYRLENLTNDSMHSLSVYVTSPAEAVSYVKKLQCFCYEELMISPKCIIDLPILFSIDEEILNEDFNEITINYILLLKDKK